MLTRDAKDAAKSCELVRAKILVAKDQDRMLGEGLMDPGDGGRVERCGKVDTTNLGAERLPRGDEELGSATSLSSEWSWISMLTACRAS